MKAFVRLIVALSTMSDEGPMAPPKMESLAQVQSYLSERKSDLVARLEACCPVAVRDVVVKCLESVTSLDPDDHAGLKIDTGLAQFHIASSIGECHLEPPNHLYIYKIGAKKVQCFQTPATVLVLGG